MFPEFAFIDAVTFLRRGKQLSATDGGNELVNAIETEACDGFTEIGRRSGAEVSGVAELQSRGREGRVIHHQIDDLAGLGVFAAEQGQKLRQNFRRWRQVLDAIDVIV